MHDVPERYNVSQLLDDALAAGCAEKPAFLFGDQALTYGALMERVCRMGNALRDLGLRREERVLLLLDDAPAFPVAFFGATRIGAVPVPVNPRYRAEDFRFFLRDSEARVLVVDDAYLPAVEAALGDQRDRVQIITTGAVETVDHQLESLLAEARPELSPADTHRDDMAFWLYSSGSTGHPKGVVHLHRSVPYTCETYARHVLEIAQDDVVYGRVLYHAYGLGNALTFPLWARATSVLDASRPSPAGVLAAVQRYRPTLLCLVPTLYNAILNDPASETADLSSLRRCISAAEPLPPETLRRWRERFGLTILDGIGSTEMLHIFCSNTATAVRPGSTGKPVPGYDLRIVNDAGPGVGDAESQSVGDAESQSVGDAESQSVGDAESQRVADGETGTLQVRGGSAAPFYWRNREKSVNTMRGEWMLTGDRYRRDGDGFYWYEGRADDMIKVGGEWVSPIEIENTLLEHPDVGEAAVVGIPVDGLMRIKAVVVLRSGRDGDDALVAELQEWCKARRQRYQFPHIVDFAPDLPKTMTGKIQRYRLRDAGSAPTR